MEEKSIIYSPKIIYSGEVKVSLVDADGRVRTVSRHNAGEEGLFKYLAQCLCGINNRSSAPRKLDMGYISSNTFHTILPNGPVSVISPNYLKDGSWCAVLGFTVNNSEISSSVAGATTLEFRLLGGGGSEVYATAKNIPSSVVTQLVPGTTLSVEWTLSIQNVSETPTQSTPSV